MRYGENWTALLAVVCRIRMDASGCLPELEVLVNVIPVAIAARCKLGGYLNCACEGVGIPHIVGRAALGTVVPSGHTARGYIHCPLAVDQPSPQVR